MHVLKKQFWDFETKCRLELLLGILNSTFIRPVRAALAWSKKKPKKQQHSLRNEELNANRASDTEGQRRERLRIRREKDRARR